jgi:ABC-2 type transport system permease protein
VITRIMKHEWNLLSRERVLFIIVPIYVLMLAYGVLNGGAWRSFLQANVAEATRLADDGFKSKLATLDQLLAGKLQATIMEDPRLAAPLARYKGYEMAAKPPSSTAAIAIGQSDVVPSYVKVQWKPMFKQTNTEEIENPENLATGAFDLSFVLIYLYPLLIIALSYNILSSERENGTQALLLSQPVSLAQFVAGKILLRGAIVVGVGAGISLLGVLLTSPGIVADGQLWRLGALALILLLYGGFWFGLAVLVNAFGAKSATNALIMMATWLGLVLIVPAGLNLAAKTIYPLPSRIEMVQALRRGDAQAARESKFDRSFRADLLRKSEEEALEASTNDFYAKVLPLEERAEQIALPIFKRFETQRAAQQDLAERMKYLSPAAVTQIALSELANHSAQDFNDFTRQVEAYHEVWRNYFLPSVMANRLLTREELENIPRFKYQPQSNGVVAARVLGDLVALLIFAGVVFAAGFASLKRYPAGAR